VALAGGSDLITTTSIGKGKLGQTRSAYKVAYGKPKSHDALEGGLVRFKLSGARRRLLQDRQELGPLHSRSQQAFKTAEA